VAHQNSAPDHLNRVTSRKSATMIDNVR